MDYIVKFVIGLCFIYLLAVWSEFQYWNNGKTYPNWLATQLDTPFKTIDESNFSKVIVYLKKVCGNNRGLMAVTAKGNGLFMRCDNSLTATSWLDGVYKINLSRP